MKVCTNLKTNKSLALEKSCYCPCEKIASFEVKCQLRSSQNKVVRLCLCCTLEASKRQFEEVSGRISCCERRESSYTGGGQGENSQTALATDGAGHTEGDEQGLPQGPCLGHHTSHQSGQTLLGQHLM